MCRKHLKIIDPIYEYIIIYIYMYRLLNGESVVCDIQSRRDEVETICISHTTRAPFNNRLISGFYSCRDVM